ncbi:Mannan endo-1,4-beta-mannosidase 7 [Acorus calamus]|uniref:Mannan endo-1,4-beta-mannosidase 7 n=1 Tax=Acorus calamus TaxID=4465 RepID=A0AAV9ESV6_ACOCL|nr:Mannan endo-1,4-beta-mannosidase 7 [Acorus calamus]
MATKVKSIDSNHLLEVGLEGFYGDSMPDRKKFNPGGLMFGTDFISNNQISGIDFATIHTYPDQCGGGSGCGALFWQWLADGMDQFRDGYEVVISKSPSTALIISSASHKLVGLDH